MSVTNTQIQGNLDRCCISEKKKYVFQTSILNISHSKKSSNICFDPRLICSCSERAVRKNRLFKSGIKERYLPGITLHGVVCVYISYCTFVGLEFKDLCSQLRKVRRPQTSFLCVCVPGRLTRISEKKQYGNISFKIFHLNTFK